MNYEEMSDFEINKMIAAHLHGEDWWHKYKTVLTMQLKPTDSGGMAMRKFPVDYCNNPSDTWSIIVENKINLSFGLQHVTAKAFKESIQSATDKNPLRAAMICFLKMKDAEK